MDHRKAVKIVTDAGLPCAALIGASKSFRTKKGEAAVALCARDECMVVVIEGQESSQERVEVLWQLLLHTMAEAHMSGT